MSQLKNLQPERVFYYFEEITKIPHGSGDMDKIASFCVDFAKEHKALEMKIGYVDGQIADINMLNQLSAIPSREGLLTMLAGGLMGVVKDLSICLDLYSQDLEK